MSCFRVLDQGTIIRSQEPKQYRTGRTVERDINVDQGTKQRTRYSHQHHTRTTNTYRNIVDGRNKRKWNTLTQYTQHQTRSSLMTSPQTSDTWISVQCEKEDIRCG